MPELTNENNDGWAFVIVADHPERKFFKYPAGEVNRALCYNKLDELLDKYEGDQSRAELWLIPNNEHFDEVSSRAEHSDYTLEDHSNEGV